MSWQYNTPRWAKQPRSFLYALMLLIGHLLGSCLAFVSILAIAWGIGFAIHSLNSIFPFDLDEAGLIHKIQVVSLVLDLLLVSLFVFAGAKRFIKDLEELSS
jgi:hypothetical protein